MKVYFNSPEARPSARDDPVTVLTEIFSEKPLAYLEGGVVEVVMEGGYYIRGLG